MKKFTLFTFFLALGCMIDLNAEVTYSDNFNTAHDYMTGGVTGTIWSGILNAGDTLTAAEREDFPGMGAPTAMDSLVLNANGSGDDIAGALKLSSYISAMDERYTPFVLYINIPSNQDFEATLKIVGGDYLNFNGVNANYVATGLVAEGDSGDWVSIQGFDKFNFAYLSKSFNGYIQQEDITYGADLSALPFMKLAKTGSNFYTYVSADGTDWEPIDTTAVGDIVDAGTTIRVGICHNIYDARSAAAYVDDFKLYLPNLVSIEKNSIEKAFDVYYSNSNKSIILKNTGSSNKIESVKLVNISGNVIDCHTNISESSYEFSAPSTNGLYIVKIETAEGKSFTKKVVVY